MAASAKIEKFLKSLRIVDDYNRELKLQALANQFGEGFAAAVRREFERQQQEARHARR